MTPALTLHSMPRRRDDVVAVELDGEVVLYGPDGTLHKLDVVGSVLWQHLDGEVALAALVEDLAAIYPDADRDVIAADVCAYVQRLLDDGLVEAGSATDSR